MLSDIAQKIEINFYLKLMIIHNFGLQHLILLISKQRSPCLSTLHSICLVTSHWSGDLYPSVLGLQLPLFILITQTDLVYHQQFGLVDTRSFCLGDKLSSLVHEDVLGTFWRWPPEQTLHVMVLSVGRVHINKPAIHKALESFTLQVGERAILGCQHLPLRKIYSLFLY